VFRGCFLLCAFASLIQLKPESWREKDRLDVAALRNLLAAAKP
jgi:hypothetical protein